MISQSLICFGLGLDILGVIALYFYGLPSRYPENVTHTWGTNQRADPKKQRRFRCLSYSGLLSLVLGFALQIIGTLYI